MLLARHEGPLTLTSASRYLVVPLSAVSVRTDAIFWILVERFVQTHANLITRVANDRDWIPATIAELRTRELVSFNEAVRAVYQVLSSNFRIKKPEQYFRDKLLHYIEDVSAARHPVTPEDSVDSPDWRLGGCEFLMEVRKVFRDRATILTTAPVVAAQQVMNELYLNAPCERPSQGISTFLSTLEFDRDLFRGEFFAAASMLKAKGPEQLLVLAHSSTVVARAFDQGVRQVILIKSEDDPIANYLHSLAKPCKVVRARSSSSNHRRLDVISDLRQLHFR